MGGVYGEGGMWVVWVAWAVRSEVGHALAASHPMGGYAVKTPPPLPALGYLSGKKITRERGMGTFFSSTLPDLQYTSAHGDVGAGR